MALPSFLQPCLASYDLKKLDKKNDKKLIITAILNKGDDLDIKWLGKNYTIEEIKTVVAIPTRGMWFKQSLLYWQKILDVKVDKLKQVQAYIHLDPQPNLYKKLF